MNTFPKEIFRFVLVGMVNTLFGYLVYASAIFLGAAAAIALLFSYALGIPFSYLTFRSFVFLSQTDRSRSRFFSFIAVYLFLFLVNLLLLDLLIEQWQFHKLLAQGIVVPFCAALSFLLNRFLVFAKKPAVQVKGRMLLPFFLLTGFFLIRLAIMLFLPLNDVTEARYGEIARKMLDTDNWVTLFHDEGVPFLAKPPLSTWASALSMKLLGVSAFADRLPSLLFALGTLFLIWIPAQPENRNFGFFRPVDGGKAPGASDRSLAWMAPLILTTSLGFAIASGAVMTDLALLFSVTLMLVSFWKAHEEWYWGYLFFVGIGLGLLAKGPIACILGGLPILLWMTFTREWRKMRCLPWGAGPLLMFAIALPWYLLAEARTPGFLHYFFVGEHLERFLKSSWKGDLYGTPHALPYGMIWVFTFAALFPWSLAAPFYFFRKSKTIDAWQLYLLCWFLATPLFFTLCSNIIWPYCLPALPGFALLLATKMRSSSVLRIAGGGTAVAALLLGAVLVAPQQFDFSQKEVVAAWQQADSTETGPLFYWRETPSFSAAFYSKGRAKRIDSSEDLKQLLLQNSSLYLVVSPSKKKRLPEEITEALEKVTSAGRGSGYKELLCKRHDH